MSYESQDGSISKKGSNDGRPSEPVSMASIIPAARQPLKITSLP